MNLSTLNPNELVGPSGRNVQSAYFDGTGDYLQIPYTSAFDLSSGDFTIEAWFNSNSFSSQSYILAKGTSGANLDWGIRIANSNTIVFGTAGGATNLTLNTATLATGTWYHVALVRSSGTNSAYLNGVQSAQNTMTFTNVSLVAMTVGCYSHNVPQAFFNGYISDVRIVKGTAVYTSNFTPPTAPLTPITNTSLLLGFSEYQFIDQSPNNFTITRNGDTTQSTFGPYGNNWSNYFDGTGDDLSLTGQSLAATDWTVECWVYFQSFSNNAPHVWNFGTDISNRYNVWRNNATGTFSFTRANGGTYDIKNGTTVPVVGRWYHLAVVRVNSTQVQTLYVDGVAEVTNTGSISTGTTWTLGFVPGGAAADRMLGYISNLRVVTSAVYTANFTPPTAPLPVIPNTSLLTCQSNRFLDSSPNNRTITRNGDVSVQPYVPFPANWSNFFDGNGDYLSRAFTSTTDGMYPQGTTYTIEAWFYASLTTNVRIIYDCSASNVASFGGVWLGINAGAAQFNCRPTTGGTLTSISGGSIAANSWNHIAASVNAGSGRLFLNGNQVGSTTTISACSFTPVGASVGRLSNGYTIGTPDYAGYISNVRVVQSTAIYTSNFTPPTAPLSSIPNTSLLTCQSSSFTDFSPNNFTITVTGDVSARFYGPFAGPVPEPVVDVYTTTGVANTWIKRPGAKAVQMIAIGAGGGGGGGAASANNLSRTGGGGGGGGANGQIIYTADQLPSTLYIRVGASGTGGTSTAAGGAGGNSTIAAADPITSSTSVYCMGGGGGGGKGGGDQLVTVGGGGGGTAGAGTTGTGSAAVAGGLPALGAGDLTGGGGGGGAVAETTLAGRAEWGGAGGGSTRQFGNTSLVGGSSLYGGGGGGQGGSMSSNQPSPSPFSATSGGNSGLYINSFSYAPPAGAAATTPANGGAGQGATTLYACGHGGGGGYANVSGGAGYTGGAGGFPGGGGGGGGASTVAGTGGVGGAGGAGRVVLITFF